MPTIDAMRAYILDKYNGKWTALYSMPDRQIYGIYLTIKEREARDNERASKPIFNDGVQINMYDILGGADGRQQ